MSFVLLIDLQHLRAERPLHRVGVKSELKVLSMSRTETSKNRKKDTALLLRIHPSVSHIAPTAMGANINTSCPGAPAGRD